jgi:hypothetical protein
VGEEEAMTTEQRVYIEIADILGIEIECPNLQCKVRYHVPVQKTNPVTTNCPLCNEKWFSEQGARDHVLATEFVDRLNELQAVKPKPLAKIRLLIADSKREAPSGS